MAGNSEGDEQNSKGRFFLVPISPLVICNDGPREIGDQRWIKVKRKSVVVMNILLLSRYGTLGASSRVRSFQYIPYLKEAGIHVTVSSLLDNQYIMDMYNGKPKNYMKFICSYLARISDLLKANQFQLLWVEKELFPWLPAWAEVFLTKMGCNYLVDYDDPLFHNYDQHSNYWFRMLMGKKIDSVMKHAQLVLAGNPYIGVRARQAGAKQVEIIPTVIDLKRYEVVPTRRNCPIKIGWIGSPNTAQYLKTIQQALSEISKIRKIQIVLVGAGAIDFGNVPVEIRRWTEESEVRQIQDFDIGIMPLSDEPQARGKCGYKLIQYMACGRPVVASPVGVNNQIVEHGINGFHANSTQEWVKTLSTLCDSSMIRGKMGQAGRRKVEENYCIQRMAPRLSALLLQAGSKTS